MRKQKNGKKSNYNNSKGKNKAYVATSAPVNSTEEYKLSFYDASAYPITTRKHEDWQPANQSKTSWMLDSGATDHYTPERSDFSEYEHFKHSRPIEVGNGKTIDAIGIGTVEMQIRVNNDMQEADIQNVLHVPSMNKRLLSTAQLAKGGINTEYKANTAMLKNAQEEILAYGYQRGRQYWLDTYDRFKAYSASTEIKKAVPLQLLHRRLGHLNEATIKVIDEATEGITISKKSNSIGICMPCLYGKQPRGIIHKPSSRKRQENTLDLVHTDVMGPLPKAKNGNQYILTFIDDNSHWIMVYFLQSKDQTLSRFKQYLEFVERQTGNKLKKLCSDRGGEYMGETFKKYCEDRGIDHKPTIAYTPQHNGVAERMN